VKLDFTSRFNSLHRRDMLLALKDRLAELYAFCYSAYSKRSRLFYGSFILMSNEGPQQGEPIGPLLFSNAIDPLSESLYSELLLGYLDNVMLDGQQSVVATDVEVGRDMGLVLNVSKCELIAFVLQSFQRVQVTKSSFPGALLFRGEELDRHWADRC